MSRRRYPRPRQPTYEERHLHAQACVIAALMRRAGLEETTIELAEIEPVTKVNVYAEHDDRELLTKIVVRREEVRDA